jgi:hypothetical protein
VYVSNVFSCCLQTLHRNTRIPYLPWALQMLCKPSHTFQHPERHTNVEGVSALKTGIGQFSSDFR